MKQSYLPWLLSRLLVGLLFAYAGFTKIIEPVENFRAVIAQYEVIPYGWITLISFVVPWLELISGIFLIVGYMPKWSAFTIAVLSFSFVIIIASSSMLLSAPGGASDCGCFGANSPLHFTVRQMFFLDLINFVLTIKLFSVRVHEWSIDHWLAGSL